MAVASNFPAIRPSLNLDFANAKSLDPRITFSRASAATYYDGKTVAKAEENLLLNSAILATQSVTTRAEPYTLSFIGTGTVTLSGTSTAGPLVGTGAANRVSLTFTPTAGTLTLTVTGAVERAQLEARSVATAYNPTTTQPITNYIPVLQTTLAGVPRFDHNPLTGESLGLLVEEQRTNLATYSEQLDNNSWNKVDASISANSFVAPDGSLSAGAITILTSGGYVSKTAVIGATSGQTYTISIFTNTADRKITFGGATPNYLNAAYNSISIGNGWHRHTGTVTLNADGPVQLVLNRGSASAGTSFAAWGAQAELGSFPTSYIKTEASQVTRAADSAQMTGANFSSWYRQDEGTLLLEAINEGGISGGLFGMSDGTINNKFWIQNDTRSSVYAAYMMKDGVLQSNLTLPGAPVNAVNKVAMAYKANDLAATRSGYASIADNSASIPVVNKAVFNAVGQETAATSSGWIRRAAYYPKRLADAQLQALTA